MNFEQCWSLVMGQHPELRENTDLSPLPFAPHLMRQTEVKKSTGSAPTRKTPTGSAQQQGKVTSTAADTILIHGMDVGLTCPLPRERQRSHGADLPNTRRRLVTFKLPALRSLGELGPAPADHRRRYPRAETFEFPAFGSCARDAGKWRLLR